MAFKMKEWVMGLAGAGALNWLLDSQFGFDLLTVWPGGQSILVWIIGVSGALVLADMFGLYKLK